MTRSDLTRRIKEKARELGFDEVGIARAEAISEGHLREWLGRQYQGEMAYIERKLEKRLDPGKVLEGARSIVSLALGYNHPYRLPYDQPDKGVISRYAAGTDYHEVIEDKLGRLLQYIRAIEPETRGKVYVDTGPMMDKYWAQRSGLGWLGKHTNVLSRDLGSWFFIGEILLDCDLDFDEPAVDFCGSCTRCIESCPTDAIVEPYVLDSRRCISYLTIELRGDIPEAFREPMGNLIYGCDICQDVCPWNSKAPVSAESEFKPREPNQSPALQQLARMSQSEFRESYRGSPMKRAKWKGLMRNVAVAMGNSRNPDMIPELENLLATGDEMIQSHAAWALRRLGTPEALQALEQHEVAASLENCH